MLIPNHVLNTYFQLIYFVINVLPLFHISKAVQHPSTWSMDQQIRLYNVSYPMEYYGIYWYDKSDEISHHQAIVSSDDDKQHGGEFRITNTGSLQIKLGTVNHGHLHAFLVIDKDQSKS